MTTATPEPPEDGSAQAKKDAEQDALLKAIAAEIAKASKLGFDPTTIKKATVAAVNDTSSPPTVSLNISGDTQTLVSQVRLLNNYTPIVGQTVLLVKQGAEIFILGSIASAGAAANIASSFTDDGWVQVTLAAGSHNGNSNGNIECRRVLDNGSWKMQWRGGWNVSGTTLIAAGGLDPDYRPSARRTLLAGRNEGGGGNAVKLDFNTDGSVLMWGGTTAPSGSGSTGFVGDLGIGTSFVGDLGIGTTFVVDHSHGGSTGGHSHGGSTGGHSHSVTVTTSVSSPTWVSLNGLEYFL